MGVENGRFEFIQFGIFGQCLEYTTQPGAFLVLRPELDKNKGHMLSHTLVRIIPVGYSFYLWQFDT